MAYAQASVVVLHSLDDLATVRKLVAFYVTEHNQTMPHSALTLLRWMQLRHGTSRMSNARAVRRPRSCSRRTVFSASKYSVTRW